MSIDRPLIPLQISADFEHFLKDPGPLNSKKLFFCIDWIMCPDEIFEDTVDLCEVNQFRGFLHRLAFPVFSTRFFDIFFHLQHTDFTENIYLS